MFVSLEYAAADFDDCLIKKHDYRKRAAGPSLTISTMTNASYDRIAADAITHRSAKTATLMHFRHFSILQQYCQLHFTSL